jgi:hypothetical protein
LIREKSPRVISPEPTGKKADESRRPREDSEQREEHPEVRPWDGGHYLLDGYDGGQGQGGEKTGQGQPPRGWPGPRAEVLKQSRSEGGTPAIIDMCTDANSRSLGSAVTCPRSTGQGEKSAFLLVQTARRQPGECRSPICFTARGCVRKALKRSRLGTSRCRSSLRIVTTSQWD